MRAIDPYPEDHFPQAQMQILVEQNTMMLIENFAIFWINAFAVIEFEQPLQTFHTLIVEDHAPIYGLCVGRRI